MTERGAFTEPASKADANLRPQFVPVPFKMIEMLLPEAQAGRLTTS